MSKSRPLDSKASSWRATWSELLILFRQITRRILGSEAKYATTWEPRLPVAPVTSAQRPGLKTRSQMGEETGAENCRVYSSTKELTTA